MYSRVTRSSTVAAALLAAVALTAAGCGTGGDDAAASGPSAEPSGTATATSAGSGEAPVEKHAERPTGHAKLSLKEMAKAKPRGLTAPSKQPETSGNDLRAPERDSGRPGSVAPEGPGPGSGVPRGVAAAPSAVHKKRPSVARSPRIGRLFGDDGHGGGFSCSASVVPSHGKNLIVTAGHCLWDGKTGASTAKTVQFVPGYYAVGGRSHAPYGIYTATTWHAYKAWSKQQNWRYDYAFIKLTPGSRGYPHAGQNVQNVVGAMGLAWNQRPDRTYASIGYDAQKKYGWDTGCCAYYRAGRAHWVDSWAQLDLAHRYSTGGASGGPWLIHWNSGKRMGTVGGVNSRSNRRSTATSAYFGSALKRLYYRVR